MDNYDKLVERISRSANITKEEIDRKVEAKRAKLSGLVSKEGAAQIVAAELGINFDEEKMKLSELVNGMKKVNTTGKIIRINPIREFNKNNRQGKVASLLLADETSNARLVLWDTKHIELIEQNKLKENDVVEITGGNLRNGEIHLSSYAEIKLSDKKMENVVTTQVFAQKDLKEVRPGETVSTRAVIVQAFEPRYFEVCPKCGKKAIENECKEHGKIQPIKRALLNIVLDDGTETIRSVMFGEQINALGLKDEEIFSLEEYAKIKSSLLGEEKIFSGQIRSNQLYNTTEFTIQQIENIKPETLIQELEAKSK